MFTGKAEAAIRLYAQLFEGGTILSLTRYGTEGPGAPGSVLQARFTIAGLEVMAIDSPIEHAFGFMPATSLSVSCGDEALVKRYYRRSGRVGRSGCRWTLIPSTGCSDGCRTGLACPGGSPSPETMSRIN